MFPTQTLASVRRGLRDIDDSYSHPWDVSAELMQNSVDAIRRSKKNGGEIDVHVNCATRSITVRDNGDGIDSANLIEMLSPFGSDKHSESDSIGEKGVGLTFALFQSNRFRIETAKNGTRSVVEIENARTWKESSDDKYLTPESTSEPLEDDSYTEINFLVYQTMNFLNTTFLSLNAYCVREPLLETRFQSVRD